MVVVHFCCIRKTHEKFTSTKKPLKEAWPKRFSELLGTSPILYTTHFQKGMKLPKPKETKKDLIFVSVASYRDDQCPSTLTNIIKNADHPENLRIVVCQQNSPLEKDCLKWCKGACTPQITKIQRLNHLQAKGPTWARWRIQQEWSGEEYFLQIDAHTRMIPHWDTILKEQLALCPSLKPVLTQYPLEYNIVDTKDQGNEKKEQWQLDKARGSLYVQKFDDPDGFIRIQSDYTTTKRRQPWSSVCWAAGFSFSKGDFITEAGYDPNTPFLFFGEEMDIAARAFTHGWDFFSPSENVVFHNYKREHRSTFWENPIQKPLEILSRFRIYVRLGYLQKDSIPMQYQFVLNDMDSFPLGKERSLQDWEKLCGISIKKEEKI